MALPALGLSFAGFPWSRPRKETAEGDKICIKARYEFGSVQHLLWMAIRTDYTGDK